MLNKTKRIGLFYVAFKWVVLAIYLPVLILNIYNKSISSFFVYTLILFIIYNSLSLYFIKRNKFINLVVFVQPYFDILFVTLITIGRGGLISDSYILYFIILNIYSAVDNNNSPFIFCLASMLLYGLSCFTYTAESEFNVSILVTRLFYFPIAALTAAFISRQSRTIKKDLIKEKYNARIDPLTQIGNRLMLKDILLKYKKIDRIKNKENLGILIIDLDDFKKINDSLGHKNGDEVLRTAANIINESLNSSSLAFRIGGEEFLVLLENCNPQKLYFFGEKIRKEIKNTYFKAGNRTFSVTVSIGGVICSTESFETAMKIADERMYAAKQQGKNKLVIENKK